MPPASLLRISNNLDDRGPGIDEEQEMIPAHDVRTSVCDETVGWLTEVRADANLISHGPARNEQASFVAGELCDPCFKGAGGRVLKKHVVE